MTPLASLLILLVAATAVPASVAPTDAQPAPHRLFVTNYRDDTVSVIDGQTRREEKVLPAGGAPQGIAYRPNPPLIAVANSTGTDVTLIDPIELKVLGSIPTGPEPEDVVFSPDGKKLFATSAVTAAVHVLDVESRKEIARLPAASTGRPVRVRISPDGAKLYALVRATPSAIWIFDVDSHALEGKIEVGRRANDFTVSKDGKRLVSSSFEEDRLYVVEPSEKKVLKTHEVSTGSGLIGHPTESRVFSIASFDGTIVAVDWESGAELGKIELGDSPQYGVIDPAGETLFVAFEDANRIVAIDADSMEMLWRVGVGDEPADIEYVPLEEAHPPEAPRARSPDGTRP